jgi:hypothetical protein
MIGRKATIGFSLLCALVFCVLAAPSASAKGTTAFECAVTFSAAEFSDAHCDQTQGGGTGYKHVALKTGAPPIEIIVSNEKTENNTMQAAPAVLNTTLKGAKVSISCEVVSSGAGTKTTFENKETGGKMEATGLVEINFSKCTVTTPKTCEVKEPIVVNALAKTVVIKESPEEMGVELSPAGGPEANFTTLTFKAKPKEVCGPEALGPVPVKGSTIGTIGNTANGAGATLVFKEMNKLTVGGEIASLESTVTVRKNEAGGNALTLTTTAN